MDSDAVSFTVQDDVPDIGAGLTERWRKRATVATGWMVRVLPRRQTRPPHDAAELANPPYRTPTPILISTDFAFRAQDAVAWNPRTFQFFIGSGDVKRAEAAYQATLHDPEHPVAGAACCP